MDQLGVGINRKSVDLRNVRRNLNTQPRECRGKTSTKDGNRAATITCFEWSMKTSIPRYEESIKSASIRYRRWNVRLDVGTPGVMDFARCWKIRRNRGAISLIDTLTKRCSPSEFQMTRFSREREQRYFNSFDEGTREDIDDLSYERVSFLSILRSNRIRTVLFFFFF